MGFKISHWFSLFIITTAVYLAIYVTVHQSIRLFTNDPQIQISEDIANTLAKGADAQNVLPYAIDLSQSLTPFVIVYDSEGQVVSSTAVLNGETPKLPQGVLDYAKAHGQNRITWEPQKGVREAIVVTYFEDKNTGYVLVGRSLREAEKRINLVMQLIAAAWAGTAVLSLVTTMLFVNNTR